MVQALTIHQKQRIIAEHERRKKTKEPNTQKELGQWAKEILKLSKEPNQATISRLLSSKTTYTDLPTSTLTNFKTLRSPAAPRLESALYTWMCDKVANGVQVNGVVLRHQAARLQQEANKHLPNAKQLSLKFSKGWLARFQNRHGVKFRRVHGEALSADRDGICAAMPVIRDKLLRFKPSDIWNADEFGLFYRQPPGWSLSAKAAPGFKKDKTRMSFLACCNSDGSEKFPLMIIGNALRPRPFHGKYGHDLGFDYYANKKAWMTQLLFFAWLGRLDGYIGLTENRKILLMVDNCSAHGSIGVLPPLQNVEVFFLPPNTTSHLQPLDAGIIAALKSKFRRRILFRVFDNIDSGKKSIYNVDQLTAMRWVGEEWSAIESTCIRNCFQHCFKDDADGRRNCIEELQNGTLQQVVRDLHEHAVPFNRVSLESLLNPGGEDAIIEEFNDESHGAFIAGLDAEEHVMDIIDDEEGQQSTSEELKALAVARSVLERLGMSDMGVRKAFVDSQRELRLLKQSQLRQTAISDHFQSQ